MRSLNYFFTLLLLCTTAQSFAQNELYNDGANIHVQAGGLIYVQGEVINDDQGVNIGTIRNLGDIQLTGNWTNNSTSNVFTNFDPGTTTFLGAGLQTVGGITLTAFNNLTLGSPGNSIELRLLLPSLCDGVLDLEDDFMNTQAFVFTVANAAAAAIQRSGPIVPNYTGATTEGYVTSTGGGRLARNTLAGFTYFYPVGTATLFRPVEITPNANGGVFAVDLVDVAPPNSALLAPTLWSLNPYWYHKINKAGGAGAEDIRIYHDFTADDVCDINYVTISEWDGGLWQDLSITASVNPGAPFLSHTTKSAYPGAYPTPYVTEDFALAGLFISPGVGSCVFPVELLYLQADAQDKSILVSWETETEKNNAGFELQRSVDGINFSGVTFLPGAGNSQTNQYYDYDDFDVMPNTKYFYRLKQVDFNGNWVYSNVVEAILPGDDLYFSGIYPNPGRGTFYLQIGSKEAGELEYRVFNSIGQLVMDKESLLNAGLNTVTFELGQLPKGAYMIELKINNQLHHEKLVIE